MSRETSHIRDHRSLLRQVFTAWESVFLDFVSYSSASAACVSEELPAEHDDFCVDTGWVQDIFCCPLEA